MLGGGIQCLVLPPLRMVRRFQSHAEPGAWLSGAEAFKNCLLAKGSQISALLAEEIQEFSAAAVECFLKHLGSELSH